MPTVTIGEVKYEVIAPNLKFDARKDKWIGPANPKGLATATALKKGIIKRIEDAPLFDQKPVPGHTEKVREERSTYSDARYFIQLERGNLHTAYAFGLIYPVAMEHRDIVRETTRARDPQTSCQEYLVVSEGFTRDAEDQHVLVEVLLTPKEAESLIPMGETRLLPSPVPVSRVKTVWTLNDKVAKGIVASGKTFSDALFPASIIRIADDALVAAYDLPDLTGVPKNPRIPELSACKNSFDHMLGMLAFMRNTDRYFTSSARYYCDVSRNYLPTLAQLATFESPTPFDDRQKHMGLFYTAFATGKPADPFYLALSDACVRTDAITRQQVTAILSAFCAKADATLQDAAQRAFGDLFDDGFRECLRTLLEKPKLSDLAYLAFLYRYRNRESNDKLALKQQFPSVISDPKKAELILAILGTYYGYGSLPKDEEIAALDPSIASAVGALHPIKFSMEDPLDRLTVEAAFRRSFPSSEKTPNMQELAEFLSISAESDATPAASLARVRDESFQVMGTRVRRYVLIDEKSDIISLIRQIYQRGRSRLHYLAAYALKRFPGCVGVRTHPRKPGEFDVEVEDFIRDYEKASDDDASEIRDCIEMDRKHSSPKGYR